MKYIYIMYKKERLKPDNGNFKPFLKLKSHKMRECILIIEPHKYHKDTLVDC